MAVTIIGGNKLSAFYSTALFVPWSAQTVFTPFSGQGGGFQYPYCQATIRPKYGLADATDSFSPFTRTRRQTETDFDTLLNVFYNPDNPPRGQFAPAINTNGYQLYLTLSVASMYPAGETPQYYWIPSVFVEEVPHRLDLKAKPVAPIEFDLIVRSNSPAFFLPTDATAGTIAAFQAYCASIGPNPWGW